MIEITVNTRQFTRWLTDVERRQVPFATAQALTATAFAVRRQVVERTFPAAFKLRNRRFPRVAIRVAKATKRSLSASVFDRLGRDYLKLHATGGTKRPRGGRLAVPTTRIRRTKSGRIPKGQTPTAVRGRKNAVVAPVNGGKQGIWRRRRGRLELLYTLQPSARIRKRLRFFEDANAVVTRQFPRRFRVALAKAVRTARR